MISDLESLLAEVRRGGRPKYLFFWLQKPGADGTVKECLWQWWEAPFEVEGQRYATAEHFMAAEKARLFGDEATRREILETPGPASAALLGLRVRPFDEQTWAKARTRIAETASFEKFRQNPALAAFLVGTGEHVLVEASPDDRIIPDDRIWGIGLAFDHPDAESPECWHGLNLLGFALMKARERLREQGL
jgi:ribA/ribD-fused uncharacterized protein